MNNKHGLTGVFILLVLATLAACGGNAPEQSAAAITAQPTDQSVVVGTTATFNMVATDATGYQWQSSTDGGITFSAVNAATAASYTVPATTMADTGTKFRVVVTGASNSVTSSAVTLTVTAAPVAPGIAVHPANQTITEGQNASFSVTATGTSLNYQWRRSTDGGANFTNVAGANSATLNLTAVPLGNSGQQFLVVVSNSSGSVTSNAALLTVNAAQMAPAFTTQPASIAVVAPGTATFNAAATGTPNPTLQWQLSTNGGGTFADIPGATGGSYTTPATDAGVNGNQYRVIATNASGAATSAVATLTVDSRAAPIVTTQPTDVTITEGQNAQFSVAVSGTPTPTLQWQLSTDSGGSWNNITGATGTTFDVLGAALANNGRQFRAVATNGSGAVNSAAATLTVNAVTPALSAPLATGKIAVGTFHTCAVKADATAACWGHGSSGEVRPGSTSDDWTPQVIPGLSGVTYVAAGQVESCAIDGTGTLWCWGGGRGLAAIQDGSGVNYTGVKAVAAGFLHQCFIDAGTTVRCWGNNSLGQLGADPALTGSGFVATPVFVNRLNSIPLTGVVSLSADGDGNNTCALTSAGEVVCWGNGNYVALPVVTGATAMRMGSGHACAVMAAGGMKCWGANGNGQLGNRSTTASPVPVSVIDLPGLLGGVTSIATQSTNTCVIPATGRVVCWGAVDPDRLNGINTFGPTEKGNLAQRVVALSSGRAQTCALVVDGSIECWGSNQFGQLGLGHLNAINSGGPFPPSTSVIGGAIFWH